MSVHSMPLLDVQNVVLFCVHGLVSSYALDVYPVSSVPIFLYLSVECYVAC